MRLLPVFLVTLLGVLPTTSGFSLGTPTGLFSTTLPPAPRVQQADTLLTVQPGTADSDNAPLYSFNLTTGFYESLQELLEGEEVQGFTYKLYLEPGVGYEEASTFCAQLSAIPAVILTNTQNLEVRRNLRYLTKMGRVVVPCSSVSHATIGEAEYLCNTNIQL